MSRSVESAFRAAGLTWQEEVIAWSLARGDSLAQAGRKADRKEKPMSRQRAHQIATAAARKLGIKGSLVQALQNQRTRGKAYAADDCICELGAGWTAEQMRYNRVLRSAWRRARRPLTQEERQWRRWSREARRLTGMI